MASDQPAAAEVAEDFRASLVDLTNNDRYAINNFTVIARENTEYASEISDVLIEHIGKTKPDHKLPALYVLDSIAKNIGSPYTLFLAHRLYSTYMNAYSSVDRPTRRKLDEMLKTWRNPIPGSLDPRPVFPAEITGKIMNALHQSTTRAAQFEQQQQRNEQEMLRRRMASTTPAATQWRETPTPPQAVSRYPPPQGYLNGQTHSPYPNPQNQFPPPLPHQQYPPAGGMQQYPQPYQNVTVDSLHHDIEGLIRGAKEDLILNINNQDIQAKLKALLDLQQVLRSQQLPPSALSAVRDQLRALQMIEPSRPPILTQTVTPLPVPAHIHQVPAIPQPIAPPSLQYAPPPPVPVSIPPVPTPTPMSSTNLAELLSSMQKSTPAPLPLISTPQLSIPTLATAQPPLVPENPLFAQLRAAGLLSSNSSTPTNNLPPTQPPAQAQPTGPINLADLLKSVAPKISVPLPNAQKERIELTSNSVKIPRPHLISKLYEAQPNQCTTCGKRFLATDEGKREKATHLDWHFHTNQRLAESSQKGSSRSWYLEDEMEWIQYRAPRDSLGDNSANEDGDNSLLGPNSRKQDPKTRYVRVPSDNVLANSPCPICQERFEVSRNEEIQDFVWMDAIKIGGRIYHASCYADMVKDGANTPARTATPDSVLGKRKAESSANPSPNKMVKENIE